MEHGERKKEKKSNPDTWVRPVEPRRRHRYTGEDPFGHLYESGPMEPERYKSAVPGGLQRPGNAVERDYLREFFG